MIDEIIVFIMPIILTDGIDLFRDLPEETKLELTETKSYASGAVQLKYNLK